MPAIIPRQQNTTEAEEVQKLREENTRLREEIWAMQEAVDKFASEFAARTSLLLATLNKPAEP